MCILWIHVKGNNGTFNKIDCNDSELNTICQCAYDDTQDYIIMACQSILDASLNRLPPIAGTVVRVINSYDRWPIIPAAAIKTFALFLSENQIDSIGDLKNLAKLQYFNMSHNQIRKIDSSISTLTELYLLDVSFNLIEDFRFEDLVPNSDKNTFDSEPIFSKLKYLILNGNRIKQIYNFDLVFTAMPVCNFVTLDLNMITNLDVTGLSHQSHNVIDKIKEALKTNSSFLDVLLAQNTNGYYYGFNANLITSFNVNFREILNDIFAPYRAIFFTRFLSISLVSESGKIICECNTILDISFLTERLVEVFQNDKVPEGDLENFVCYKKDSDTALNLFSLISQNSLKTSDFCDGQNLSTEYSNRTSVNPENTKKTTNAIKSSPNSSIFSLPSSYYFYFFYFIITLLFSAQ